jgi:hypothetical protein
VNPTADAIDALLPQTQCRQCGYGGCRPYAEAVAAGTATINRIAGQACAAAGQCTRRTGTAGDRSHRRGTVHRLHTVHRCLPGGCHRRRTTPDAYGNLCRVHRLRAVPAALPCRLHRPASHRRGTRPQPATPGSSHPARKTPRPDAPPLCQAGAAAQNRTPWRYLAGITAETQNTGSRAREGAGTSCRQARGALTGGKTRSTAKKTAQQLSRIDTDAAAALRRLRG